jgi:Lactonase, 7-bladed beta-propeller
MRRKIHKLQSILLERVLFRGAAYYLLLVLSLRGMEHSDSSLPRSVPPSYGQERSSLSQAGEKEQQKEEWKTQLTFRPEVGGELHSVPGSPFLAGTRPYSVTYFPTGHFCAVANSGSLFDSGDVSVYRVGEEGELHPVSSSPFPAGTGPYLVRHSPTGRFCAVANYSSDNVSVYRVGKEGELTPIPGSPFPAGKSPKSVTYSPNGRFCAVANYGSHNVSVYRVGGADKEKIALLTAFLVDRSPDLPASYLDRLPGEVRGQFLLPYLLGHRTY